MSKVLHKPSLQDLRDMIDEAQYKTPQQEKKEFREMEILIPSSILGYDNLEQLQVTNYSEALGSFNFGGL